MTNTGRLLAATLLEEQQQQQQQEEPEDDTDMEGVEESDPAIPHMHGVSFVSNDITSIA